MAVVEFGSKRIWTRLRRSAAFPMVSVCRGKTHLAFHVHSRVSHELCWVHRVYFQRHAPSFHGPTEVTRPVGLALETSYFTRLSNFHAWAKYHHFTFIAGSQRNAVESSRALNSVRLGCKSWFHPTLQLDLQQVASLLHVKHGMAQIEWVLTLFQKYMLFFCCSLQ